MRSSYNLPGYFILHRLHSFIGVFSLGLFIFLYFHTYSLALHPQGVELFNNKIHSLKNIPFLFLLEMLFIFLPLFFHFTYNFVIWFKGQKKITGILAFIFVGYHIYATFYLPTLQNTTLDYLWMVQMFETSWKVFVYLVGGIGLFYYFANAVWNFLIDWGIVINKKTQKNLWFLLGPIFIFLSLVQLGIILNLQYHYAKAPIWAEGIIQFVKWIL